jgi:SapC
MTRTVVLNNHDHHRLRILTKRNAALGDDVMLAYTFPAEFRSLQAHYPVVFQKSNDGTTFHAVALLGLQEGQNLFLGPNGWEASTLPLAIEREPFYIGKQGEELLVHIDIDSPRVSETEGEPLFLEHGGSSEALERINSVLLAIHEGLQAAPAFVAALLAHDLLESFVLDVEDGQGGQSRLAGFYTIKEERLAALEGPALTELHGAGHLEAIYMAVASLSNFRALVDRHQRRLATAHA